MRDATDSVTDRIDRLRHGDPDAARPLWQRDFTQLVRLARLSLDGSRTPPPCPIFPLPFPAAPPRQVE